MNCFLGALKQYITFVPCHRDPRRTCGDKVFITWVPRVHTGRTSQGRKKKLSLVLLKLQRSGGLFVTLAQGSLSWLTLSHLPFLQGLIYAVGMPASSSMGGKNVPVFMCSS